MLFVSNVLNDNTVNRVFDLTYLIFQS